MLSGNDNNCLEWNHGSTRFSPPRRRVAWKVLQGVRNCKVTYTRILIVDDFPRWYAFISERLEFETGLMVISGASDGLEAVQKARLLQPDVILMDVNMPGLNGFEATQQIRTASPCSKILFLSGVGDLDFIERAFSVGGLGYILKSDVHADLVSGIRTVLCGQRFLSRSLRNLSVKPVS